MPKFTMSEINTTLQVSGACPSSVFRIYYPTGLAMIDIPRKETAQQIVVALNILREWASANNMTIDEVIGQELGKVQS